MTVLETLRCPNCSTSFGLRAARVRVGIRRAQCFRCDSVFGIEEVVARLLAPPGPEAAPLEPQDAPPSLDLGDLEGAEEGAYPVTGANFASARDAIAKLMGAAPEQSTPPKSLASRSSMDVEATLSALDHTLGGNHTQPGIEPAPSLDMASTMKLTAQEIQAALALVTPPAEVIALPRMIVQPVPEAAAYGLDPALPQDPNLLKIQLEQETCNNVSTEQMTAWIEQGRVHEYHMVARQFSDHWIEASKVPALRPIFEQRRRSQGGSQEDMPIPPAEILPPKKSLFGGLFGRN